MRCKVTDMNANGLQTGLNNLFKTLQREHGVSNERGELDVLRHWAQELAKSNGGSLPDDWDEYIRGMATFGGEIPSSFYARVIMAMRNCVSFETGLRRSLDWVSGEIWNLTNQFGMAFGEPVLTDEQMRWSSYLAGKAYRKSDGVVSDDYLSFFLQAIMLTAGEGKTVYERVVDALHFCGKSDCLSRDDIGDLLIEYMGGEPIFPEEDPTLTPIRVAKDVSDWALGADAEVSMRGKLYSALVGNLPRLKESGAVDWDESLPMTADEARQVIHDCDVYIGDPVPALIWIRASRRISCRLDAERGALLSSIAGAQFFDGDDPTFYLRAHLKAEDFGSSHSDIDNTLAFLSGVFRAELNREMGREVRLFLGAADFETELG